MWDAKTLSWFERNGLKPPEHIKHDLTPDDLSQKVERAQLLEWRQEGNRLICRTNFGELVNHIPTDMMMTSTDEQGLPILTKLDIRA